MTSSAATSRPAASPDLWTLALRHQHIDPATLMSAIDRQVSSMDLDFRTRLLVRDSLVALRQTVGEEAIERWLA